MIIDKKSQFHTTEELIIWLPRIIVIAVIAGIVFFLITMPIKQNFQIDKLQQGILMQRFVYSENCLAYKENDRIYPGIIDSNKFNDQNLRNCFQANNNVGIRLNLITNEVNTVNLNDRLTEKFDFCFDKKHFTCSNYNYYVLINDNNEIKTGLLNINMIKIK